MSASDYDRGFADCREMAAKAAERRVTPSHQGGGIAIESRNLAAEIIAEDIRALTPTPTEKTADDVDAMLGPLGVYVDRQKMRAIERARARERGMRPKSPPPRYDDVYAAGVAAMDAEDGAPTPTEKAPACSICGELYTACKCEGGPHDSPCTRPDCRGGSGRAP